MNTKFDFVIVGGGLSGLVSAQVLTQYGFSTCLIERDGHLGSHSTSFSLDSGEIFDYGYHALDYERSILTSRYFQKLLEDKVRVFELERGIVLRGNLMKYNSPLSDWPESVSSLFGRESFEEDFSSVDVESLRSRYGEEFMNLVVGEVLPSYHHAQWKLEKGVPSTDLLSLAFPWFFPKSSISEERGDLGYHDRVRLSAKRQQVMYPREGGFGEFVASIVRNSEGPLFTTYLNANAEIDIDSDSKSINSIRIGDDTIEGGKYLWCGPIFGAAKMFGLELPSVTPQKFYLGSFCFDKEIDSSFHEILVGDPQFRIDRISFPGRLQATSNRQIQAEWFFPGSEELPDSDLWMKDCLDAFEKIGIPISDHVVENQNFFECTKGFLTTENLHELATKLEQDLSVDGSNLVFPHVGYGPENINQVVPSVISGVTDLVCSV